MRTGFVLSVALLVVPALSVAEERPQAQATELYGGWLKMYDLKFDDAHQNFAAWKRDHPQDSLGPASNAAAYLFSELARLGALESELFVDDSRFKNRPKLTPDKSKGAMFLQEVTEADHLADVALQKSAVDAHALFVRCLTSGLRADYAGLVEKRSLAALDYTKQGRIFADKVLEADPKVFDAYLGPGVENYLLSLKPAPLRVLLRMTGSNIDREKGLAELRQTAQHGYYLEPFAKLLLAVAAMRDNNPGGARQLLEELHRRFPDNELYFREMNRIEPAKH